MSLETALDALDKATPGKWYFTGGVIWCVVPDQYGEPSQQKIADCYETDSPALIAAAPEALAWIKRAVPYLATVRPVIADEARKYKGDALINYLSELDALLKEVKE